METIDQELIGISKEVLAVQRDFIVRKDFTARRLSGKSWRFDFAVMSKKRILIKTVSPHGNSVNANFVAFSDVRDDVGNINYCVYARRPHDSDVNLLNQVANVIPVSSLHERIRRAVNLLH
jgi:hypothetical protein